MGPGMQTTWTPFKSNDNTWLPLDLQGIRNRLRDSFLRSQHPWTALTGGYETNVVERNPDFSPPTRNTVFSSLIVIILPCLANWLDVEIHIDHLEGKIQHIEHLQSLWGVQLPPVADAKSSGCFSAIRSIFTGLLLRENSGLKLVPNAIWSNKNVTECNRIARFKC